MEEKIKTTYMQFRIDQETKAKFMQLCQQKDINSSALIRRLLTQWINEQLHVDLEHKRSTDI